ncbi:hypothetical protein ERO13_A03G116900v2 [Gossypium hirsutum]|uniref:Uncharacterized protein n=2 Tax=Gossypium TaxID=3633 RepID=A0A5J5WF57_GOSBA|nr:hypothetical protein ES319_A03G128500v1 [Gossypium barbadense]KAG4208194.1 hypothetical protein ERO13_A03G116900v2 [Gossypium hirsutum]TYH25118.1 hypothetical protein ES288_A03G143800v1 [Gossypium darwinii]
MPFLIILNLRFSLSYIQPSLCHFILSTISFDSLLLPPSLPIEEIHFADPTLIELPGYRQSPLLQNRLVYADFGAWQSLTPSHLNL